MGLEIIMKQENIIRIREKHRLFWETGRTKDVEYRISVLKTLQVAIHNHEKEIFKALYNDLGKSAEESYMTEIGMIYQELRYMIHNIPKLSHKHIVKTPITQFASFSYEQMEPLGTVLIISPWNYPFLLTMDPLIDALAAGNTVFIKPSEYAPETSRLIQKIIKEVFPEHYVITVLGEKEITAGLLKENFDLIFFTGSKNTGRLVLKKAAEKLTPVILELGGKSPCVVDETADIKLAARRIVWGKFLNCGQTCVAPDYVYCDKRIRNLLVKELIKEIQKQYGRNPIKNAFYGKIINEQHYRRILQLMDSDKIIYGGESNKKSLQISPTLLTNVTEEDKIMSEEIFGPILPILTYKNLDEMIDKIENQPHPLALYIFSKKNRNIKQILSRCSFGGGCINDTIIHLDSTKLGFGGVGESGMGNYHGKHGFESFSHCKSIVDKKTWIDLPMRYQPYKKNYMKLIHALMR